MEATQQEGLTGSCLGTRSSQAIKAFSREKLAMAASTVRNTECKRSLIEKEFEKNLKSSLLFAFTKYLKKTEDNCFKVLERNFYSLVITVRLHTRKNRRLNHRKKADLQQKV